VNTWIAKRRQDAVKQVLVDCFCKCSHSLLSILVDSSLFILHSSLFTHFRPTAYAESLLPCLLRNS
jgi:hypothetical protein